MDAQLKKGLLEGVVLGCLKRDESYGYKIIQDIEEYIEISESTLYPILKRLEAMEYVSTHTVEHKGRLRKYFSITEKGITRIAEFKSDLLQIERIYRYIAG